MIIFDATTYSDRPASPVNGLPALPNTIPVCYTDRAWRGPDGTVNYLAFQDYVKTLPPLSVLLMDLETIFEPQESRSLFGALDALGQVATLLSVIDASRPDLQPYAYAGNYFWAAADPRSTRTPHTNNPQTLLRLQLLNQLVHPHGFRGLVLEAYCPVPLLGSSAAGVNIDLGKAWMKNFFQNFSLIKRLIGRNVKAFPMLGTIGMVGSSHRPVPVEIFEAALLHCSTYEQSAFLWGGHRLDQNMKWLGPVKMEADAALLKALQAYTSMPSASMSTLRPE